MINPSAILNTPNFSGQFSLPPFTPYSLLTLNNLPNSVGGVAGTGTPIFAPLGGGSTDKNQINPGAQNTSLCIPLYPGDDCTKQLGGDLRNAVPSLISNFNYYLKASGLLLLALLLLAFGLYMLANATDTGKTIINTSKDALLTAAKA